MVSFTKLNNTLSTFEQRFPSTPLIDAANQVAGQYNVQLTSKLGALQGEVVNGIQALTAGEDYPGQFGDNIFGTVTTALTGTVPGLVDSLITDISELFSGGDAQHSQFTDVLTTAGALAALTNGSPTTTPFLQSYFSGSGGQAIQRLLGTATGKPVSQLLAAVSAVQGASAQAFVQQAFAGAIGQTLGPVIAEFNVRANLSIGTALSSTLQNIVDAIDTPIVQVISTLTQGKLKTAEMNSIARLIETGDFTQAIATVAGVSSLPISQVESGIGNLSTKLSDRVDYNQVLGSQSQQLPDFEIGSNAQGWDGVQTPTSQYRPPASTGSTAGGGGGSSSSPYEFTFISGVEELEADLRSPTREITEVVVHWTASFLDQDHSSQDIHNMHLARGFSGMGYHYLIRRDGRIQRGRPINRTGAHAKANGHNNKSIGISLVGGYTCLSGTAGYEKLVGSESINAAQMNALELFLGAFYIVYPGGQAFGHSDTDPRGKIDPGFSVPQYVKNKFNKTNITGGTTQPLTVAEIASARGTSTA
jgi:N-acetylmuramoyl-L-alanine amidase